MYNMETTTENCAKNSADTPLVTVSDVSFSRQGYRIFEHLNLSVPTGKITAIMGPSGTGKTTLLKLIGGQLIPDTGEIFFQTQNIHQLKRRALYQLRKKMGLLFQQGALFTDLNVFDNVAFPLREHRNFSVDQVKQQVLEKLASVGLEQAADFEISQLSGGMARRVALARSIALSPELMMYDEPFTGQDPISMGVLVKLIQTLNQQLNLTTVIVSHDVEETLSIADYVYILADGKVIGEGTPEAIKKSKEDEIKQFIHGLADGPVPFHFRRKAVS